MKDRRRKKERKEQVTPPHPTHKTRPLNQIPAKFQANSRKKCIGQSYQNVHTKHHTVYQPSTSSASLSFGQQLRFRCYRPPRGRLQSQQPNPRPAKPSLRSSSFINKNTPPQVDTKQWHAYTSKICPPGHTGQ